MANVAQLIINITANVAQFNRNINNINQNINNMSNNIRRSTRNSSSAFDMLGGAIRSAFRIASVVSGIYALEQAIGQLINSGVEFNKTIQDTEMAFKVMTGGNIEEAKKLTGQMIEMARTSPLSTQEVAKAGVTLNSFGVETENLMGVLTALGNVARGDNDRFQRLSLAFGQMTSAGRLMGQETLQFINAGFNPLSQIADVMAKKMGGLARDYMPQLKKAMEDGAISSKMVSQAFMIATSEGGKFHNSMVEMAKTFSGQMNIMKDNVMILMAGALKPLMDFMASTLLPIINGVLERLIMMFKLFGIEIKSGTDQAKDSLQGFADSMGKSAKEQKKNKKATDSNIQSFDELHVLQKQINDESENGGGGIANLDKMLDESVKGLKQGNPVEEALNGVKTTVDNIVKVFEPLKSPLKQLYESMKGLFGVISDFKENPNVTNFFKALIDVGINVLAGNIKMLSGAFDILAGSIKTVDGIITGNFEKTLEGMGTQMAGALKSFSGFINQFSPDASKAMDSMVLMFQKGWTRVKEDIKKYNDPTKLEFKDFNDALVNTISNGLNSIKTNALEKWSQIKTVFSNAWSDIKAITWDDVKNKLLGYWDELNTSTTAKFTVLKENLKNIWGEFLTYIEWDSIKNKILGTWDTLKISTVTKYGELKKTLSDAWAEITGLKWDTVEKAILEVWDSLKKNTNNIFSSIKTTIINLMNDAIDKINTMIKKIRELKITIPPVVVMGKTLFAGETIPMPYIPDIPRLASGGIVTQPTMAMIGEGKYDEAVIPLGGQQLDVLTNAIANAVVQAINIGGNKQANNGNIVLNIDGREFARVINPYMEKEQQRKGISVVVSNA